MFKTKFSPKTLLSVVNNDELYFIEFDKHGNAISVHDLSVDKFLAGDRNCEIIAEELKEKKNTFLILPDYWSGNISYLFQSKRVSLAKAFIERKLLADHPDLPDIKYFYDFTFGQAGGEDRKVNVVYLQNTKAFQLYHKLGQYDLNPIQISCPALLWEQKLTKVIPNFDIGGTCLVHLLFSECFLYFFSRGRFLFSRLITLPDLKKETDETSNGLTLQSEDRFNILTYEINQSLYLFSQKTKSEMGDIYMLSPDEKNNAPILSDNLGKEVVDLNLAFPEMDGLKKPDEIQTYLGPVEPFNTDDLSFSKQTWNLTHGSLKKKLEWKPVQSMGIFLGFLLLSLLTIESFFLWGWFEVKRDQMARSRKISGVRQKQLVTEYSNALDLILAETDRPSPRIVIIKIGQSLPDNVWITDTDIDTETEPGVIINGIIKAPGTDELKYTLAKLLKNLGKHFKNARSLKIQDIDFRMDKNQMEQKDKKFLFTLKFNLK